MTRVENSPLPCRGLSFGSILKHYGNASPYKIIRYKA